MGVPPRVTVSVPFLAGLILLTVGCYDDTESIAEPVVQVESHQEVGGTGAFYYHRGERIPLTVDASRLVLATRGSGAMSRVADVLESLGMSIQDRAQVALQPRHEIVTLGGPISSDAVRAAVARLRLVDGVTFASPAYHTADEGHEFVPLDRIMVEFEAGVGPAQIDEVNRLFGTRTVRSLNPDSAWFFYILAFPDSLDVDPMDMVARLYEHEYVRWADVEKLTNRRLMSIPTDPYYQTLQYYLRSTHWLNNIRVDINPDPAWERTLGGGRAECWWHHRCRHR